MFAIAAPLDAVRSAALRAFGRRGRAFLGDRSRRVALYGVIGVLSALIITCFAPLWGFALGPIVLGVPHLLADVRYLIVRPGLTPSGGRRWLALATAVPLLTVVAYPWPVVGLCAGLGVITFARTSTAKRAIAGFVWGGLIVLAHVRPNAVGLVILHGHNLLAVALFFFVFTRRRIMAAIPALAFVAIAATMLAGLFDEWLFRFAALTSAPQTGMSLTGVVATIAPLSDPTMAVRLAFLFVFAQSVHYAVWLRLVPEEARERPGIRSFASSFRALGKDLGAPVLVISAVAVAMVLVYASRSLDVARIGYLRVAAPHAYLEIAFTLLVVLEGRVPSRETRDAS